MKDYQAQLEKLRRDAAECALIRDLATDSAKRELFDRLAVHVGGEAVVRFERLTKFGREFRKSSLSRWMLWFPVAAASLSHGLGPAAPSYDAHAAVRCCSITSRTQGSGS